MTNAAMSDDLRTALRLADLADEVTMAFYLSSTLRVETKPDTTPVTEADKAAEQAIRAGLAAACPGDAILGEEFGSTSSATGRTWIIDPIDGTKNYLRGVPVWCTLIALATTDANGLQRPVTGVVSAPAMGRRWYGDLGAGSHTVDVGGSVRRLAVSSVADVADASFSYSDRTGWAERGADRALAAFERECWRTRAYGDFLSHVLVAEGAVDFAAEPALAPWDMAALVPVVVEAGGRITGFDVSPAMAHLSAVTSNGVLHEELLNRLKR